MTTTTRLLIVLMVCVIVAVTLGMPNRRRFAKVQQVYGQVNGVNQAGRSQNVAELLQAMKRHQNSPTSQVNQQATAKAPSQNMRTQRLLNMEKAENRILRKQLNHERAAKQYLMDAFSDEPETQHDLRSNNDIGREYYYYGVNPEEENVDDSWFPINPEDGNIDDSWYPVIPEEGLGNDEDCQEMDFYQTTLPSAESMNKPFTQPAGCGVRNDKDNFKRELASLIGERYPDLSKRIVGGGESDIGEWPWLAKLDIKNGDEAALCGGTLISNKWIVTAAHCLIQTKSTDLLPKFCELEMIIGEHDMTTATESSHQTFKPEAIIVHKNYDKFSLENDIALIRLSDEVVLRNNAHVACLPESTVESVPNKDKCFAAGWGHTENSDDAIISTVLLHVNTPLISKQECNQAYSYGTIADGMMCAGHMSGGKDSCQGDSGGGMVCQRADGAYMLTGVVSWGDECAREGRPGVYADVRHYLPWIKGTIYEYNSKK